MTLTQAEEGRTLAKYEGMYHNRARRYDIPGLDHDDKVQQARIAALIALRKFDPDRPRANLAGWLTHSVEMKLTRLRWQATCPRFTNKVQDSKNLSLEFVPYDGGGDYEGDTFGDTIPGGKQADSNLFLMACESLCGSEVEVAILEAVAGGGEFKRVADAYGITGQYLNKLKNRLMTRLKKELA
jgi:hypothetical protein